MRRQRYQKLQTAQDATCKTQDANHTNYVTSQPSFLLWQANPRRGNFAISGLEYDAKATYTYADIYEQFDLRSTHVRMNHILVLIDINLTLLVFTR